MAEVKFFPGVESLEDIEAWLDVSAEEWAPRDMAMVIGFNRIDHLIAALRRKDAKNLFFRFNPGEMEVSLPSGSDSRFQAPVNPVAGLRRMTPVPKEVTDGTLRLPVLSVIPEPGAKPMIYCLRPGFLRFVPDSEKGRRGLSGTWYFSSEGANIDPIPSLRWTAIRGPLVEYQDLIDWQCRTVAQ